jgi:hypothetical protein
MAVADTCVDSPDPRILSIASYFVGEDSPHFPVRFVYQMLQMYLSGCKAMDVPRDYADIIFWLQQAGTLFQALGSQLESFALRLGPVCYGYAAASEGQESGLLADLAEGLNRYVCGVAEIFQDIWELVKCSNIYPLYAQTVHETLCHTGMDAFCWTAATQFVVAIMSMLLITCRAAFFEIEVMHEIAPDDEGKLKSPTTTFIDEPVHVEMWSEQPQIDSGAVSTPGSLMTGRLKTSGSLKLNEQETDATAG